MEMKYIYFKLAEENFRRKTCKKFNQNNLKIKKIKKKRSSKRGPIKIQSP